MARKGDIDSKSVASRVPMEVYLRLLKTASSQKKTLSSYLCDVLSEENFGTGGQIKIEYRDKIIDNPILIKEIEKLNKEICAYGNFLASIWHIDEVMDIARKNTDISFVTMNTDEMKKMLTKQYEIGRNRNVKKSK